MNLLTMETSSLLTTIGSILLSLTVTFVFNYCVGLPKKIKKAKELEKKEREKLVEENKNRDARIAGLEDAINALTECKEENIRIQKELKQADVDIMEICQLIKEDVSLNRSEVLQKLERLESREKNSLRAKILEEYRLYTDTSRNPKLIWSEMEAHSFFQLVEDYEELGGNDYIHEVVLPDMNRLDIVKMSDAQGLKELYSSRK